uniref:Adenylyl-sulfate kinase n=2 Tax=Methanococcaceae TaxID=2183 RepID=A0AA82WPC2_METTL|nr:Chain A, APS kinase from Methanothermococcus thermolithotrophicus [Methanothermococcus thermolithotrophicus DSM 2095]8A8H_B Chain B, APS kinase from Methanothermococcus thermolithotrophicus [Methanothermococcus thermolithotrophicus DSM 2095]8A8H_C Chain C, APS kinase from Methanothermococcus thermolithotrophicus [Methanothermococcus thermolithotrophicus DSM 2095]8A8H_D Chain D, APS kinase from Methanothermococcus thermolithotrophicus [Methanothermococcus thermolithotrophicus DSM 2095]
GSHMSEELNNGENSLLKNLEDGFTIWLTGPSGAGKSTLAYALEKKLLEKGFRVEILDGDVIRNTLYPNIGFSKEAREMHNRVVIHLAKLLSKNGVITIVSLISPYRAVREYARKEIQNFMEVYIHSPLEVRIQRDPKGLYAKALKGEIKGLTGYDGVYEEPENPELKIESHKMSIEEEVDTVIRTAQKLGYL